MSGLYQGGMYTGGMYIDYLVSTQNESKQYFYLIKTTQSNQDWFLFDIEDLKRPFRVLWIPHKMSAFKFTTEQAADDFREMFLSPRTTEIVRVNRHKN